MKLISIGQNVAGLQIVRKTRGVYVLLTITYLSLLLRRSGPLVFPPIPLALVEMRILQGMRLQYFGLVRSWVSHVPIRAA